MVSDVRMTRLAQNQLSQYIGYIKQQFRNPQAAKAVAQDARETKAALLECVSKCREMQFRVDLPAFQGDFPQA